MEIFFKFRTIHIKTYELVFVTTRRFRLSSFREHNKEFTRQVKVFNKLIGGGASKKRRSYFVGDAPTSGGELTVGKHLQQSKENNRRIAVLNSLFMKYISDLLVTGNIAGDILGKGLEISRVAMTPNFNQLNVFWSCTSEQNATVLETVLPQLGINLRQELTQLQVMGVVPRIAFIKDKHLSRSQRVEYLLSVADYGEDYTPYPLRSDFKDSKLPEAKGIEDECIGEQTCDELMPVMRQDVFNLDHDKIMEKILKTMKKSKALHRYEHNIAIDCGGVKDYHAAEIDNFSGEERKEAMEKFILARKLLKEKKHKNRYNSDLNAPLDDPNAYDEEYYDNNDFERDDYFEEDTIEDQKYKI